MDRPPLVPPADCHEYTTVQGNTISTCYVAAHQSLRIEFIPADRDGGYVWHLPIPDPTLIRRISETTL